MSPGPTPSEAAPTGAWIARSVVQAILSAYGAAQGAEPCGLLLGRRDGAAIRIEQAVALRNVHAQPFGAFLLDPDEQLTVVRAARADGRDVVGVWHGHLTGGPWPGRADRLGADSPLPGPPPMLLVAGRGTRGRPVLRAFVVARGRLREVRLRLA